MKRFIVKLSLFLLPLLLLFGGLEMKLSQMPNTYSQKRADLERQLAGIRILVLGPSNALHGIDPAFFSQKGYNLANASQTIFYDSALTAQYLSRLASLKLVLIPITYNSMYTQLYDSKESFRCFFYSRFWGIEAPQLQGLDLRQFSYTALYTPQTAFEFLFKGFKVDLLEGLSDNGYLRYDTVDNIANISYPLGAKRVELYRRMMKQEHFNTNVSMLTHLATTLRQHGVQVCFITTPVCQTFAKYCEPEILNTNIAVLSDICRAHGCGFKNYFTDSRFTISDFYDNDHLNARGAQKFSVILDREVNALVNFN